MTSLLPSTSTGTASTGMKAPGTASTGMKAPGTVSKVKASTKQLSGDDIKEKFMDAFSTAVSERVGKMAKSHIKRQKKIQ